MNILEIVGLFTLALVGIVSFLHVTGLSRMNMEHIDNMIMGIRKRPLDDLLSTRIIQLVKQNTNEDQINQFIADSGFSADVVNEVFALEGAWLTHGEVILEFIEWILTGKCAKTLRPNPLRVSNQDKDRKRPRNASPG